jgi:hypothetical protein
MAQSLSLRQQVDRCRRLAREVTDTLTRERLESLADEFEARADAQDGNELAAGLSAGAKED